MSNGLILPIAIPWFGLDIGGTLAKLVYFVPDSIPPSKLFDRKNCEEIKRYLEVSIRGLVQLGTWNHSRTSSCRAMYAPRIILGDQATPDAPCGPLGEFLEKSGSVETRQRWRLGFWGSHVVLHPQRMWFEVYFGTRP